MVNSEVALVFSKEREKEKKELVEIEVFVSQL